jgi:hypothetical protein
MASEPEKVKLRIPDAESQLDSPNIIVLAATIVVHGASPPRPSAALLLPTSDLHLCHSAIARRQE